MRSWKFLVAAAILGIGVGAGVTVVEMYASSEIFFPAEHADQMVVGNAPPDSGVGMQLWPKIEVIGGKVHEFGSMERLSKKRYTFRIKNVGDASLSLVVKRTTCKCTVGAIEGNTYKPGEIAELEVEWTGQIMGAGPDFEQTVELETNVPNETLLSLKIRGYVTETIRAFPEELSIGRVSSNDGAEAEYRLFAFRSDQIDILETSFENPDIAQYFDIAFEPLSKEEVESEKGASCGLLAKVSIKPGLPLGPINQTIRIRAEADKEAVIQIPVKGWTQSDIIVSGKQFQRAKSLLTFGSLKRSESAKAVLNVFVTGPYRHETRLSVAKRDPENCLRVDIGPAEELGGGSSIKYLVTIEIPAGLEPVNHMGSMHGKYGRIVLETTHPNTKQIPIDVKFSIE